MDGLLSFALRIFDVLNKSNDVNSLSSSFTKDNFLLLNCLILTDLLAIVIVTSRNVFIFKGFVTLIWLLLIKIVFIGSSPQHFHLFYVFSNIKTILHPIIMKNSTK